MEELKIKKLQIWQGVAVILAALLIISFYTNGFNRNSINKETAKTRVDDFLKQILQGQNKAEIINIKEEKGLYLVDINLDGKTFNSYLSKDGTLFFPSVIALDRIDTRLYGQNELNKTNLTK